MNDGKAEANPPVSEFESPKLKIAGKSQLFRAKTGLVEDKSTQEQERKITNLAIILKHSILNY